MGHGRRASCCGGWPLTAPRERRPDAEDDLLERLFSDGSGIWDLFVLIFYAPVILGSLLWLYERGGEWLVWDRLVGDQPLGDVAMGLLIGLLLVGAARVVETTTVGERAAASLTATMGHVTWPGVVVLGAVSALGEELLFRGVLQSQSNLWVAAILYALAHVPFREAMWPWTLQALVHGIIFGFAYDVTGALVVPLTAHALFGASELVRWKMRRRAARRTT